jgi:hypothetical protein
VRRHLHPLFDHPARADGPAWTPAAWAEAEAAVGFALPEALAQALQTCNGGRLRRTFHRSPGRTRFGGDFVQLRDLLGVGYPGGLAASRRLARQWDYPAPCAVLSCEGPVAVILDGRDPKKGLPVLFIDTDADVEGAPEEHVLAGSFADFEAGLSFHSNRMQLALLGDLPRAVAIGAVARLGARVGVHDDFEGGQSLILPDWPSSEVGPCVLRLRENRLPDGALALPELADAGLLLECTITADEAPLLLAALAQVLPAELLMLGGAGL